jgi:alcohol dehydrogenase YqhD (iron-dependent ADH family)
MTTPLTPLISISIGEDGTDSADEAILRLSKGCEVIVANGDVALEVLLDLGCDRAWAQARIEHALTGHWSIEAPLFP